MSRDAVTYFCSPQLGTMCWPKHGRRRALLASDVAISLFPIDNTCVLSSRRFLLRLAKVRRALLPGEMSQSLPCPVALESRVLILAHHHMSLCSRCSVRCWSGTCRSAPTTEGSSRCRCSESVRSSCLPPPMPPPPSRMSLFWSRSPGSHALDGSEVWEMRSSRGWVALARLGTGLRYGEIDMLGSSPRMSAART